MTNNIFQWALRECETDITCPECGSELTARDDNNNFIPKGDKNTPIKDLVCINCKKRFILRWTGEKTFRPLRFGEFKDFIAEMREQKAKSGLN